MKREEEERGRDAWTLMCLWDSKQTEGERDAAVCRKFVKAGQNCNSLTDLLRLRPKDDGHRWRAKVPGIGD